MNAIKKIIFPIFSLFLIYISTDVISGISGASPNSLSQSETMIIGFLITLFVTGIFAFTGFAYPTHKILPGSYYKIHNPIKLQNISKIMGVKYFQYLLMLFFWGSKKNRKKYFDGTKKGLQNFVYQTQQSEFGHIGALVVILFLSIYFISLGFYFMAMIMTLINIIGNLYPVLLQRTHRIRIGKLVTGN